MKHVENISSVRDWTVRDCQAGNARTELGVADAKTDFLNNIWRDWQDFVFANKNEVSLG